MSNGQLAVDSALSTMPDGRSAVAFYWQHNYPMAPYPALADGHHLRVDDIAGGTPGLVLLPGLEEEYLDAVDIAGEAVDWLNSTYGPYPFETTARRPTTPWAFHENQTMTLLPTRC